MFGVRGIAIAAVWLVAGSAGASHAQIPPSEAERAAYTGLLRAAARSSRVNATAGASVFPRQHFLNFWPLPQGHGSLRPTPVMRAPRLSLHPRPAARVAPGEYVCPCVGPRP